MATKAIPVVAAKVASTQTDFPVYIKPSAMTGWTTLTTAEAESIRFYSDSGLTTELAREVVSADEIHVKVPSLSTTTTIYADYDGIRADYAVGATYGRNAVWSDYAIVMHLNDGTDSTGNVTPTVNGSPSHAAGKIGNGIIGDGSNDYIEFGNITGLFSGDGGYATALVKLDAATPAVSTRTGLWGLNNGGGGNANTHYPFTDGNIYDGTFSTTRPGFSPSGGVTRTDWHKVSVSTASGANNWDFYQNTTVVHSMTGLATAALNPSKSRILGSLQSGPPGHYLDGMMDEFRLANFTASADFITTEYNNQSDVGTFWGTVTDAGGGGPTANNSARRLHLMEM